MAAKVAKEEAAAAIAALVGEGGSFARWAFDNVGWPRSPAAAAAAAAVVAATEKASSATATDGDDDLIADALKAASACKGPRFLFRKAVLVLASGDGADFTVATTAAQKAVARLDGGASQKMKKGNPCLLRCATLYVLAVAALKGGLGVSKELQVLVTDSVRGDEEDKAFAAAAVLLRNARLERIRGAGASEWACELAAAVVESDGADSKDSEPDPDAAAEVADRSAAVREAQRYLAATAARPPSRAELASAGLGGLASLARAEASGTCTAAEVSAAAEEAAFDLAAAEPGSSEDAARASSSTLQLLHAERCWHRSRALVASAAVSLAASALPLPSPPPPPPPPPQVSSKVDNAVAFAAQAAGQAAEALAEAAAAAGVAGDDEVA